ncbi:MAG: AMP-binding protein [Clostridia bacterium]|nr:AMP-binding protein [Clostridia bacterium]
MKETKDNLLKNIFEINEVYASIHTVRDLIDSSAERFGDKAFIKYLSGDEIIEKSFVTLRENSLALCRYIRSICPERMHIAVIGKTTYEYITALTGTLVSGNVFVPLAPNTSAEEAVMLFEDGDVTAIFYESAYEETAKKIVEQYDKLKVVVNMGDAAWFDDIYKRFGSDSEYAQLSEIELDPKACAAIIYTSGTTGVRKGVMLSSENLIANVTYPEIELADDDVYLSVLPMHHIFCFSCDYFKPLLDGLTVCLNGEIANIGKNLAVFQPTTMRLVPMICETLIRKVNILHKRFPDLRPREVAEKVFGKNIRWIAVGGAYLGPGLVAEYEKYGIMLRQGYGMTETSPKITTADFSDFCKDSSGKIIKSICDVRIVDGEIQVKGASVMMGYYKKPEATAEVFTEDGYLRTGDLGRFSPDGSHLYVIGRSKNLIILSNGENISPEEIEKKFADEKVIKEIIVSAENDRIVAEIFPDTDFAAALGIEDIEAYLKEKIKEANKGEKVEREIASLKIRETPFPKTTTGKIKRKAVTY